VVSQFEITPQAFVIQPSGWSVATTLWLVME